MPRRRTCHRVLGFVGGVILSALGSTAGGSEQAAVPRPLETARIVADLATGSGVRRVEARVVVTAADGEERSTRLEVPGEARVELAGPRSTVHFEVPGFWSRSAKIDSGTVRLRLHREARVGGAVAVRGRGQPPAELAVSLDGPTLLAPLTLVCPVDDRGRYACAAPAGRFDLQVRSHGFAPHFLWDVELSGGKPSTVEPITLRPGASISGFVQRTDGEPLGPRAIVRLMPQVMRDSGAAETPKGKPLSVLERESRPGERGFFVFADVLPGRYDLEAAEPGWTPGRLEGIEVYEGTESHLQRPIEISEPATLQVQMFPGVSPSGRRWRLQVIGKNMLRSAETKLCDEQGYVEFPGLPEDTYMLTAEDPGNDRPFESRVVEVGVPLTFVTWELPLVAVEGAVRLGREPIAATVTFGPFDPASRKIEADEEGRFEGVLPKAGEWEVMVRSDEHDVSRFLRGVQVPEPSEPGEVVRVDFRLPATEVSGMVVDAEYRPIPGQVIAQALAERDRSTSTLADANGRFVLRGLPPGSLELIATAEGGAVSPVSRAELPPDTAIGPIQLRVERQRTVRGSVRSPEGPVRGARIALRGAESPLYLSTTATATSDVRGHFNLEVPVGLRQAHLRVQAPGHPLTVRRIGVDESLHLSLEPVWGAAEVDWDQELVALLWMVKDGASWRFNQFVSWAQAHPGEGEASAGHTRVPRLEPGVWYLCAPVAGSAEWFQMVAVGLPGRICERLEVTAWGTAKGVVRAEKPSRKER